MSWDIALSEAETGDYSAGVIMLRRKEIYFILEVVRGRFPFDKLKHKILEVKERYGRGELLIEESPISLGLMQSLREKKLAMVVFGAGSRVQKYKHRLPELYTLDLKNAFTFAQTFSIGLRSGEYAGRYHSPAPALRSARLTHPARCTDSRSITTTSPGRTSGTSTRST